MGQNQPQGFVTAQPNSSRDPPERGEPPLAHQNAMDAPEELQHLQQPSPLNLPSQRHQSATGSSGTHNHFQGSAQQQENHKDINIHSQGKLGQLSLQVQQTRDITLGVLERVPSQHTNNLVFKNARGRKEKWRATSSC